MQIAHWPGRGCARHFAFCILHFAFCNLLSAVAIGGPAADGYPSEPWSPRVASLPAAPAADVFHAPPLGGDFCCDGSDPIAAPHCAGCESCYPGQAHSHFLPSLCRYGVVAPHAPGLESVHSPYLIGPAPWGPPVHDGALFAPPPCEHERGWGPGEAVPPTCEPPHDGAPCVDPRANVAPYDSGDFSPDPFYDHVPYDGCAEQDVYGGKYLNPVQRPLIEWGMPFYDTGPVPPPSDRCGETNPSLPRFYLYGDYRAAVAYNAQNGGDKGVVANRINFEWDLWLTATERFHMSNSPFQDGGNFMRLEFDDGRREFFDELDFFNDDTDALFFEGDLGYILGGWTGSYARFDLPVAVGLIPLLFQNGVWMEDAMFGVAATIPARNSPWLDWSNYDVTFFAGFDQITSPAFADSNAAASLIGVTTFIEAKGGYLEAGYAFLDDTVGLGRSYHNVGLSYTRRYLNLVSNSMRVIVNAGQDGPVDDRTANGVLVIAENSFLTRWPYNVIPYVNLWAGFDDPHSVARAGAAGGVLRNTGILFESDNLTGYPTLDATANETYGAAIGIDLLAPNFTHQLILEAAVLQAFGDPAFRNAPGDQYGIGARYQVPISNAHLLRFDVMHGWFENTDDATGARAEFRWKF